MRRLDDGGAGVGVGGVQVDGASPLKAHRKVARAVDRLVEVERAGVRLVVRAHQAVVHQRDRAAERQRGIGYGDHAPRVRAEAPDSADVEMLRIRAACEKEGTPVLVAAVEVDFVIVRGNVGIVRPDARAGDMERAFLLEKSVARAEERGVRPLAVHEVEVSRTGDCGVEVDAAAGRRRIVVDDALGIAERERAATLEPVVVGVGRAGVEDHGRRVHAVADGERDAVRDHEARAVVDHERVHVRVVREHRVLAHVGDGRCAAVEPGRVRGGDEAAVRVVGEEGERPAVRGVVAREDRGRDHAVHDGRRRGALHELRHAERGESALGDDEQRAVRLARERAERERGGGAVAVRDVDLARSRSVGDAARRAERGGGRLARREDGPPGHVAAAEGDCGVREERRRRVRHRERALGHVERADVGERGTERDLRHAPLRDRIGARALELRRNHGLGNLPRVSGEVLRAAQERVARERDVLPVEVRGGGREVDAAEDEVGFVLVDPGAGRERGHAAVARDDAVHPAVVVPAPVHRVGGLPAGAVDGARARGGRHAGQNRDQANAFLRL